MSPTTVPATSRARVRRKWTPAEDAILIEAVAQAHRNSQPLVWHLIAHAIPGRTNKDCRKRWHSKLVADVNKGPWTPDEDARLYNAVKAHGTKWVLVASQVETRNGDQCSKRWNNTVNPEIDHSSWTKEEDELLLRDVEQFGHNWTAIVSAHFVGRTSLSAKNRYYLLGRKLDANRPPKHKSTPISPVECRSSENNLKPWAMQAPGNHTEGQSEPDAESEDEVSVEGESDDGLGRTGDSASRMLEAAPHASFDLEDFDFGDIAEPSAFAQGPPVASMHEYHNPKGVPVQGKASYSESTISNDYDSISSAIPSPSFGFPRRGQAEHSRQVLDYPTSTRPLPTPPKDNDANMLDIQDFMMSDGLENEGIVSNTNNQLVDFHSSNVYSGQDQGNFPPTPLSRGGTNISTRKSSLSYQSRMTAPYPSPDLGRHKQIPSSVSPMQSDQGSFGGDSTRRVTISAICSADQLGKLIQAVTEQTISAKFETGN